MLNVNYHDRLSILLSPPTIVDPPPYIDGVRINSPHYLCKIVAKESGSCLKYTLVISQYEKSQTIHYTLRAYSSAPFQLKKLVSPYKYRDEVCSHNFPGKLFQPGFFYHEGQGRQVDSTDGWWMFE